MRARQLTAIGQLEAAREQWRAVLELLPSGANERAGVQREIDRLEQRLNPQPRADWKKRLGPVGIVLAFLAKFKTVALILLTKGKFLFGVIGFIALYWAMFGWWFAIGFFGSVLIHEMGHYFMVRRFGFKAELPMFLPGFGAYVKWNGANVDPGVRAQISLAGPAFGFVSALLAYGLYLSTNQPVWLAVAHFAAWLNLINLVPIFILDGGAAMSALGQQHRIAVLAVCLAMFAIMRESAFLFVGIGTGYRIWKRDLPAEPRQNIAIAFILIAMANGFLSWFCMNQARQVFGQG